jgi:hypothetical protein
MEPAAAAEKRQRGRSARHADGILACSGRVRDWQSARDADEPASVSPANDASLATIAPVLNCLVLAFEGGPADRCDAHADASAVDARFARTTRRFGPAYRRTASGRVSSRVWLDNS